PAEFPGFGQLAVNLGINGWFHDLVGAALVEHPAVAEFTPIPLLTSIVVGVGGLLVGWLMYRGAYQKAEDHDPMEVLGPVHYFLKNKYFIDEVYDRVFIRPTIWISETVVSTWIDRGIIDGTLHLIARAAFRLGHIFRDDFE